MSRQRSGDSQVGVGYLGQTLIGSAYHQPADSEFGVPENYVDPSDYRAKTPPCEPTIGVSRQ